MKIMLCDYPSEMQRDLSYEKQLLQTGLPGAEVLTAAYRDAESFIRDMQGVSALLTAFIPLPREVLERLPDLRIISVNAAGCNTIDVASARELGIAVENVPDYCTEEVATHTLALMLALMRHLKAYDRQVTHQHLWQFQTQHGMRRLNTCTLAVFGWGRIGRRVAELAKAFGLRVLVVSHHLTSLAARAAGVQCVSKVQALAEADIITNHMRQTAANIHYFDAAAFAAMKKHPVFLNAGRGAAVDEAALIRAFDLGQVRAAGLDVLDSEEPDLAKCGLLGRENVILTPHAAFYSDTSLQDLARQSCQHIIDFNYMLHAKSAATVLQEMRETVQAAMAQVAVRIAREGAAYARLSQQPDTARAHTPRVVDYAELKALVEAKGGQTIWQAAENEAAQELRQGRDRRECARNVVRRLVQYLGVQEPLAVVFFAAPYCPYNTLRQEVPAEAALQEELTGVVQRFAGEAGVDYEIKQFFPSLSDSSYLKIGDSDASLQVLQQNMPAMAVLYPLPFAAIRALDIPALNFGVYGRDAHKWSERVCRSYSFGTLPRLLLRTVEHFLA